MVMNKCKAQGNIAGCSKGKKKKQEGNKGHGEEKISSMSKLQKYQPLGEILLV